MKSAVEIFNQLNETDELTEIEAKTGSSISRSVMETVCAFSNEPGLGGGYLLLGAKVDDDSLFPQYVVEELLSPDQIQSDFATQCANVFNIPVRPAIKIELINDKPVAIIKVDELPVGQKPLYFKSDGLPRGAYRRVGPTDHKCTEDDLRIFYSNTDTYDKVVLEQTDFDDIDETALKRYRDLRGRINPAAEELTFTDVELLQSLGCMDYKSSKLTVAGILLFGKSSSLRRLFPLMRVDYIRVPGNKWVENPDERFITIDMRGPLLLMIFRIVDAIYSDLPKGFKLENENLQADSLGLPIKVLREAVTNALMHRSYRVNSPTQIIRYDNRLEIINPGFSLKSEEQLGNPGSESRNPFIASVFHETNLAETKGSGIRAMRALLAEAKLAPPTFESDRDNNKFTARLLLHHFLNNDDLKWLTQYEDLDLSDHQKLALIFVREVGAIDNNTYRQISNSDSYKSGTELRYLRSNNLLVQKGKGRGTYYIEGDALTKDIKEIKTDVIVLNTEGDTPNTDGGGANTDAFLSVEKEENIEEVKKLLSTLPEHVRLRVKDLRKRESDVDKIKSLIVDICKSDEFNLSELAILLKRDENWISRTYVKPLITSGKLSYTIPDMVKHPKQAYRAIDI